LGENMNREKRKRGEITKKNYREIKGKTEVKWI
jgi:hypothetical protein